jgi:hypothetical protein
MSLTRRALFVAPVLPALLSSTAQAQCSGVNLQVNGTSAPQTVLAGSQLQIATFNGPSQLGDWVSITGAEAPPEEVISSVYLSGTQTPPPAPLRFANFTMTAPVTPITNIYKVNFLLGNTFIILAFAVIVVRAV